MITIKNCNFTIFKQCIIIDLMTEKEKSFRRKELKMKRYKFLMKQHIGAAAIPIVKKGQKVKRGELLGKAKEKTISSNVFSSVTGIVTEVTEEYIEVEKNSEVNKEEYLRLKGNTPLELIEEAGIVGLGGAGFPSYKKLSSELYKGGTVIINAAECEPILKHNILRIEKSAEHLIKALETVMKIVKAEKGIIAIKKKHHKAIEALEEHISEDKIKLHLLEDMYPMGEERAVIKEVTGKLLEVGMLPFEANCIVLNVETLYRIYEAVNNKKPFIDKDLTVAGKLNGALIQVFEDVPIGIQVGEVIEKAGGLYKEHGEILMGGPFTGKRTSEASNVVKTTGGIIITEVPLKGPDKIGLLVCACGADKERLMEIAKDMKSEVVEVKYCLQAHEVKGTYKCDNPGKCPGQLKKVLALKKAGANGILISNCTDCSNTVMSCAPQLKLPVYHCTDAALRAVNHRLIRKNK